MYGDRYEGNDAIPCVIQKFESAEYSDESPSMVVK